MNFAWISLVTVAQAQISAEEQPAWKDRLRDQKLKLLIDMTREMELVWVNVKFIGGAQNRTELDAGKMQDL